MDWLRLWHDFPTDPKWRVITRKASELSAPKGRSIDISEVIAVYIFVLVDASRNDAKRGETSGIVSEDIAAALDMSTDLVDLILEAFQGKVMDGNRVTGWERRQVKREDLSTDRVRSFRERNAMKRNETPDKIRVDEIREEKNKQEPIALVIPIPEPKPKVPEKALIFAGETQFHQWWSLWSKARGEVHKQLAAQTYLSLVDKSQHEALMTCTRSYLAHAEPHKGYRPDNFLIEQARDDFRGTWAPRNVDRKDWRAEKKAQENEQFNRHMTDKARERGIV